MDSYLNVAGLNKTLCEEQFEALLPRLVEEMFEYGFDRLLDDYNRSLCSPEKDWERLKKMEADKNEISSTSTVGLSIIKKVMPHIYQVRSYKGLCVRDMWTKEKIEKVLRLNRRTHSSPYTSEILRQLGFMSGTSKVTIYRPLLAKRIVQVFQPRRVLDVCVGWGGRMLGTMAVSGTEYVGIEPCTPTFNGLSKIIQQLGLEKRVQLFHDKAEHILPQLEDHSFDLALTSPPYFNLEIYSEETTQSHYYGSYEEWVKCFLKPVVECVLRKLKEDGKSCWSVKNIKTDKSYPLYDDIVRLHKEQGWEKMEVEFGVGNCLRPGAKDKDGKSKTSKEITYVFTKK